MVILSTCNRSEIYFATQDLKLKEAISLVKDFYSKFFKIENIKVFLFELSGKFAIEHLYKVSAGLDSIVLGEMGKLAFRHLLEEGIEAVYMCNRNHDKV